MIHRVKIPFVAIVVAILMIAAVPQEKSAKKQKAQPDSSFVASANPHPGYIKVPREGLIKQFQTQIDQITGRIQMLEAMPDDSVYVPVGSGR